MLRNIQLSLQVGALSEGALLEGALSEGALSEGALSEGALSEGALPVTALLLVKMSRWQRRSLPLADDTCRLQRPSRETMCYLNSASRCDLFWPSYRLGRLEKARTTHLSCIAIRTKIPVFCRSCLSFT